MKTTRDLLDEAIDATAARMTAVPADDDLALRIVASLPERSGWSLHWLMPRLAITAGLAIATTLVVLRMFDGGSTAIPGTEVASAPVVAPPAVVERTIVEPPVIVRRTIAEPSSNVRRATVVVEIPDHEFSLPAIEAVAALGVAPLTPANLPEDAALTIESLTIADLPLSADPITPR